MPELRENAEQSAKGIHPDTSLLPIARLDRFLLGRQGLDVLDVRSSSLLAVGIGAPGFLLSYGTPQQTSKQEENKHGVGGCLIQLQFTITLVTHRLSAGLQSAAVILGSVAFSLPISQGCFPET